jgi:hypothetical protein
LGAPVDQIGSVNEPRTREDYGVAWNEKWIYRGPDGASVVRVVLWNRYDLVGVYAVRADGSAEPESLRQQEPFPEQEPLPDVKPEPTSEPEA